MLDEVTAVVDGYNAYFSFSKVKSGYSGEAWVKVFDFVALLDYQQLKTGIFFYLKTLLITSKNQTIHTPPFSSTSKVALLIAQTVSNNYYLEGVGEESLIFAFWSPQFKHSKHQKGSLA